MWVTLRHVLQMKKQRDLFKNRDAIMSFSFSLLWTVSGFSEFVCPVVWNSDVSEFKVQD